MILIMFIHQCVRDSNSPVAHKCSILDPILRALFFREADQIKQGNITQHEVMLQLNAEVDRLQQQYHVRIIGENGVAKGIIDLVNPIETW